MNEFVVIVLTTVLVLFAKTARSCGGHRLEVDYIRNCDSDNVIELSDNFTVVLKANCELHFRGCITAHANITSAEIDYDVQKDTIKRSGKKDGCRHLGNNKSEDIEMALQILGLPKSCPIYKNTVCLGNKSVNLSKYKLRMNILAGHLTGKARLTSNAGKSCMEFSAKLINALGKILPVIGRAVIG